MFSATMLPAVEEVIKSMMISDPIKVQIGLKNATATTVKQRLMYTGNEDGKLVTLR